MIPVITPVNMSAMIAHIMLLYCFSVAMSPRLTAVYILRTLMKISSAKIKKTRKTTPVIMTPHRSQRIVYAPIGGIGCESPICHNLRNTCECETNHANDVEDEGDQHIRLDACEFLSVIVWN